MLLLHGALKFPITFFRFPAWRIFGKFLEYRKPVRPFPRAINLTISFAILFFLSFDLVPDLYSYRAWILEIYKVYITKLYFNGLPLTVEIESCR